MANSVVHSKAGLQPPSVKSQAERSFAAALDGLSLLIGAVLLGHEHSPICVRITELIRNSAKLIS